MICAAPVWLAPPFLSCSIPRWLDIEFAPLCMRFKTGTFNQTNAEMLWYGGLQSILNSSIN